MSEFYVYPEDMSDVESDQFPKIQSNPNNSNQENQTKEFVADCRREIQKEIDNIAKNRQLTNDNKTNKIQLNSA